MNRLHINNLPLQEPPPRPYLLTLIPISSYLADRTALPPNSFLRSTKIESKTKGENNNNIRWDLSIRPSILSGIGYALAKEFLKAAVNVLICSKSSKYKIVQI
uniref:Uncharacterized protein n=1 Tax=Lactuca sativa TaxID=4236 RepID=A0A9R1WAM5_LACSA|nr:hypothetical protein LSAT_V11C200092980 [Lactuca sativa]